MFGKGKLDDIVELIVLVIAVLVIVANVMVCLLVLTTKRLRTDINGFVVSLAMSDIITAAMMLGNYLPHCQGLRIFVFWRMIVTWPLSSLCNIKQESRKFFVGVMAAVWVGGYAIHCQLDSSGSSRKRFRKFKNFYLPGFKTSLAFQIFVFWYSDLFSFETHLSIHLQNRILERKFRESIEKNSWN
ncbi:hypothetical protein QZH41_020404, partial [Actinostola sp. cb2023]